jgi:hypothetical protein
MDRTYWISKSYRFFLWLTGGDLRFAPERKRRAMLGLSAYARDLSLNLLSPQAWSRMAVLQA